MVTTIEKCTLSDKLAQNLPGLTIESATEFHSSPFQASKTRKDMMNLQLSQNGPKPFTTLANTDQARLAFIGLGKLGKDVSEVLSENFDLVGYDIRKSDADVVQAASLRDAVAGRDIVFVAVQTPHEFEYDGRQPTSHLEQKEFD